MTLGVNLHYRCEYRNPMQCVVYPIARLRVTL